MTQLEPLPFCSQPEPSSKLQKKRCPNWSEISSPHKAFEGFPSQHYQEHPIP